MKYLKLLALCLLPLSFAACSDDDEGAINTGNATVEFSSATTETRESTTLVDLPIVVSGEHNGNIIVTVAMTNTSGENLVEDTNIIITTKRLIIPAGEESVNFQFRMTGVTNDALDERSMTFEITNVEGATVGTNGTCIVNLIENNPLEGTYTVAGYSPFDGGVSSTTCALTMDQGVTDYAYLDFGYGQSIVMNMVEAGDGYDITIESRQQLGTDATYGTVYFVGAATDWSTSSVGVLDTPITGHFANGVITLDGNVDEGFGIYVSAGWFGAYTAYEATDGSIVPVTFIKQ